MPSILFICTANQFRSPLAAACLRNIIEFEAPNGTWRVESAGTWATPGQPAPDLTLQIARRLGLKGLELHRTRAVSKELLLDYDLNIVMEAGHKEALNLEFPATRSRTFMLSEIVHGIMYDIPDPAVNMDEATPVSRELKILIDKNAYKILNLAEKLATRI